MSTALNSSLAWSDAFLLGFAPMDRTHREFVGCVGAMQQARDDELVPHLEAVTRHCVQHFAQEERWMNETGFPARQCHADEHAAVLKSMNEVQDLLRQGANAQVARDLAAALADWFPGHADYMDAALSHWLSKSAHGGAPVVLRRGVQRSPSPTSSSIEPGHAQ
jgi:hemerythrin